MRSDLNPHYFHRYIMPGQNDALAFLIPNPVCTVEPIPQHESFIKDFRGIKTSVRTGIYSTFLDKCSLLLGVADKQSAPRFANTYTIFWEERTMNKYVIINEEDGMMLASIGIKRIQNSMVQQSSMVQEQAWTRNIPEALHFEVAEEAEAVMTFISDVIDWELAQQLICKLLEF